MGCCRTETIALALTAVAVALDAAAWITDFDQTALTSAALPANIDRISSFEDRFFPASPPASPAGDAALQPPDRSALALVEMKIRAAEGLLAGRLMSGNSGAGFVDNEARVDEAKPTAAAAIPLPRSRPAVVVLEARPESALAQADSAARPDDRTLLQKLSGLLPGRVTLGSPQFTTSRRMPFTYRTD
jgi:hypothetical protein